MARATWSGQIGFGLVNVPVKLYTADPVDIDADTEDVEVTDRELEMAEQLIASLTTGFDPEAYGDQHHERVMEFLRAKAEGEDVTVQATADEEAEG